MGAVIKSIYIEGYTYVNKQGLEAEVIKYEGRKNITVKLSDGFIGNTSSTKIKEGYPVSNLIKRVNVGEKYPTKDGDTVEVIAYEGPNKVLAKWLSDGTEKYVCSGLLIDGILKHPLKNKIYVGKTYPTNNFGNIKVLEINSSTEVLVEFDDGEQKRTATLAILKGAVTKELRSTKVSIGQEFKSNLGWTLTVTEYFNAGKVLVTWQDGSQSFEAAGDIAKGSVQCLNQPTYQDIGYWGYGKYPPRNHYKMEGQEYPEERLVNYWSRAMQRCYNEAEQAKPSSCAYIGCDIESKWHSLQNFYIWADSKPQSRFKDEKGKTWELDKDLLVKGNRTYGENLCTFLPMEINVFLSEKPKGDFPRGVTINRGKEVGYKTAFIARCTRYGVRDYLGYFDTPMEAFYKYKEAKEGYAKVLAEKYKDQLEYRAYVALIAWTVEPYE